MAFNRELGEDNSRSKQTQVVVSKFHIKRTGSTGINTENGAVGEVERGEDRQREMAERERRGQNDGEGREEKRRWNQ